MSWGIINSIGSAANLFGVVLLFRFGIPFRVNVSPGYKPLLFRHGGDPAKDANTTRRYEMFGWIGLGLIVFATAIQIWVSLATL